MTELQHPTTEEKELPLADRLNKIGNEQSIPRNDGETDDDYAERLVYQLDVCVEELWACQDRIRELVKVDE